MKNVKKTVELLLLVFIYEHRRADLATAVAPVSGALRPGQDGLAGHPLAVRRQAQVAHEVDETRGQVQLAAKLAGCVVVRERMVVVVESFAYKDRKQSRSQGESKTRRCARNQSAVTHQQ